VPSEYQGHFVGSTDRTLHAAISGSNKVPLIFGVVVFSKAVHKLPTMASDIK
jgi:hypothetical protein